jgi:hypothetical protein
VSRSIALGHIHHAYAQIDGTYKFPNSREGDILKQAKKEITELQAQMAAVRELPVYTLHDCPNEPTPDDSFMHGAMDAESVYKIIGWPKALNGEDDEV